MGLGKADENLNIKHAIVKACVDAGINNTEVAQILDYTPEHYSRVKQKVQDIQLVTTKRVNKAIKSLEYFTDIKNYQTDNRIKPSDVLKADEIVLDRAFPKVDNSQPTGYSFTQVNVNLEFLNGLKLVENDGQNSVEIDAKECEFEVKRADPEIVEAETDDPV